MAEIARRAAEVRVRSVKQMCALSGLSQGYYSETGTVLKRKEALRGGDLLLLFLCGMGPCWACAPASSKKHLCAITEPLIWGTFNLYQSPGRLYVQSAEIKEDFVDLRNAPDKLRTALRLYKKLPGVLMSGSESDRILTILWEALILLRNGVMPELVEFRYTWRLLNELGLAPSLNQCAECGKVLSGTIFTWREGPLCQDCSKRRPGEELPVKTLKALLCAALMKHEKLCAWSRKVGDGAIFEVYTKQLQPFLYM